MQQANHGCFLVRFRGSQPFEFRKINKQPNLTKFDF